MNTNWQCYRVYYCNHKMSFVQLAGKPSSHLTNQFRFMSVAVKLWKKCTLYFESISKFPVVVTYITVTKAVKCKTGSPYKQLNINDFGYLKH